MARIIDAVGFNNPIIIDEHSRILAGNLRYLAAGDMGFPEVPVIRISEMTAEQKRVYVIADNKLAENAGWNKEFLALEFRELLEIDPGIDLTLTGFAMGEIDLVFGEADSESGGENPESLRPDPNLPPVARPGDMWEAGPHRLLCASATEPASFRRLLGSECAQMGFCDPPYNVPIPGHVSGTGRHPDFAMAAGEMSEAEFVAFLVSVLTSLIAFSTDGAIHFVCMDWRHLLELLVAGRRAGLSLINLCVWTKTNAGMGSLYRSQHELVPVFKNGAAPHINNVELGKHGRNRTNVWNYAGMNSFGAGREEALAMHPTVKPLALVEDAILDCSNRRGIVLDAFAGSGTTLIAAEKTGRRGFGLEIEPRYVDVALRRFRTLTGIEPVNADTGATFRQMEQSPRRLAATAP